MIFYLKKNPTESTRNPLNPINTVKLMEDVIVLFIPTTYFPIKKLINNPVQFKSLG